MRARRLYFTADVLASKTKSAPNATAAALAELLPRADFPLQMNVVPVFSERRFCRGARVARARRPGVAGKLDVVIASFDRAFTPVGTLFSNSGSTCRWPRSPAARRSSGHPC